ncbi:MAG: hypothetical protein WCD49_06845 [Candidatus Acidiferrales bacterium]
MKSLELKAIIGSLTALALLLSPSAAFASSVPIRHGSDVGGNSNAVDWNLYGPTLLFPDGEISTNQEVICPGQDVASASGDNTNAGGCSSGTYIFIYQIPTAKANSVFTVKDLVGFTFDENSASPDSSTVGVIQCDTGNTTGLCTTLGTGAAASFPAITFTHSGNTSVSFHIPSVPAYPAGSGTQGQGLTVFVETHQTTPVPVAIPKVN